MNIENYKKQNLKNLAKKLIDLELFELVQEVSYIISQLDENQTVGECVYMYGGDIDLKLECILETISE